MHQSKFRRLNLQRYHLYIQMEGSWLWKLLYEMSKWCKLPRWNTCSTAAWGKNGERCSCQTLAWDNSSATALLWPPWASFNMKKCGHPLYTWLLHVATRKTHPRHPYLLHHLHVQFHLSSSSQMSRPIAFLNFTPTHFTLYFPPAIFLIVCLLFFLMFLPTVRKLWVQF